MHKALKGEAIRPPRSTLVTQQRAFNAFRHLYNDERPHEALGQRPPAQHYTPSARPFPSRLPELTYPPDWEVRRVRQNEGGAKAATAGKKSK